MSKFRDDLEKEHVMSELVSHGRSTDLANFFIMVDEVDSEDIFEFYFLAPDHKFYGNMFREVFQFLMRQLKKKTFEKHAGNILSKLYIDEYIDCNRITKKNYENRDAIMSLFIKELMITLSEQSHSAELLFVINMMLGNENISQSVIKTILSSNMEFNTAYVVEDLVFSHALPISDMLDIIECRFEYTTDEDIQDLLRLLYTTEETLIEIMSIVMDKYEFDNRRPRKVKVKSKLKGKKQRFYDFIREFLTEIFVAELECDIWEYIDKAEYVYAQEREIYYLGIFSKIKDFLLSDIRKISMVNMRNIHKQEEPLNLLTLQESVDLNVEIATIRYTYELDHLSAFKFFIRLMNLTRFGFLSQERGIADVRRLIKERMVDLGADTIFLAIDVDTYNFLLNYQ